MIRSFRVCATAAVLAAALSAGACGKKPPVTEPPPPPAPAPAPPTRPDPPPAPAPPPATTPKELTEDELFAKMTLDELNKKGALTDVFFAYDSIELNDQARAALQKNAEWLRRWASTRITVEGHCDSRGSSEYNLALGARRAAAVQEYLVSLGVPSSRITVVSKGKEQPFCTQETESCWQENRRGHFLITAK